MQARAAPNGSAFGLYTSHQQQQQQSQAFLERPARHILLSLFRGVLTLLQLLLLAWVAWALLAPASPAGRLLAARLAGLPPPSLTASASFDPAAAAASLDRSYWESRLGLLQGELGALQQRITLVTGEISSAISQLGARG
jgi:hypothetical protein